MISDAAAAAAFVTRLNDIYHYMSNNPEAFLKPERSNVKAMRDAQKRKVREKLEMAKTIIGAADTIKKRAAIYNNFGDLFNRFPAMGDIFERANANANDVMGIAIASTHPPPPPAAVAAASDTTTTSPTKVRGKRDGGDDNDDDAHHRHSSKRRHKQNKKKHREK